MSKNGNETVKMYYFIYAEHLLGVKTNDPSFKWIYGTAAPNASEDDFDKCLVKLIVEKQNDKGINIPHKNVFQCFSWDSDKKILGYSRKVLGIPLKYSMKFSTNCIYVQIGRNYDRFVKCRFMNLHSTYYLLSDIANMFLLKNGYITLYCSSVTHKNTGRTFAFFAPPNTGKSITVEMLHKTGKYTIISEDIAIMDFKMNITGCKWTKTYRKSKPSKKY